MKPSIAPVAGPACGLLLLCLACGARADVSFSVSFDDPAGRYKSYYDAISRNVIAAGDTWSDLFVTTANTTLQVQVGFDSALATANGRSGTVSYVSTERGIDLYEAGTASQIRTGIDPNGAEPDVVFNIGTGYLKRDLWFNPTPARDNYTVPSLRVDAEGVFRHEFGHAFGFNGYRDAASGSLPGAFMTTFDSYMQYHADSQLWYFTGPSAMEVYGGAVPLTEGNFYHYGNVAGRPGDDLLADLMNGVQFARGTDYRIGELDQAILYDVGVPVLAPAPEPATVALWLAGLGLLSWEAKRQRAAAALRYQRSM